MTTFKNTFLLKWAFFVFFLLGLSDLLMAQLPQAAFTSTTTSGCTPLIVNFTDQSTGATSWKWNLGNGSTSSQKNPSVIYNTPGTYTIQLTVTNGNGSNSITKTNYITVFAPPTPDFSVDISGGCAPLRVKFNNKTLPGTGSIASQEWSMGEGTVYNSSNPSHKFANPGTYTVNLTVTNTAGCTRSVTKSGYIQVNTGVKPDFSISAPKNCKPPETLTTRNLSTGVGTMTYQWIWGDGANTFGFSPSHTYNGTGPYTVTLVAKSSLGCFDTLRKNNFVTLKNIQTKFNVPDQACVTELINFENTSSQIPVSVLWNLGDGTSSQLNRFQKSYPSIGTYPVKMIATFRDCKDSISKNLIINSKPRSDFRAINTVACKAPLTVQFQDASIAAVSWKWDFGDGSSSTNSNPQHTYQSDGEYTVQLIVTNASGCSDTIVKKSLVRIAPPILNPLIIPNGGCAPLSVQFFANSTSLDSIQSWEWDLGNGTQSFTRNTFNTYDSGTYSIKLKIQTTQGCQVSILLTNAVRAGTKPTASFTTNKSTACANEPVQFRDGSTGNPNEWKWYYNTFFFSQAKNSDYGISDTGTIRIKLIVSNNKCEDSTFQYIQLLPPIAKYSYKVDCANNKLKVLFKDESIDATSFQWSFGDGFNSTLQNPEHTYSAFGTYTVVLTASKGSCSSKTGQKVYLIKDQPEIKSNKTEICKYDSILVFAIPNNKENILKYEWNFGNGFLPSNDSILYTFQQSGTVDAQLVLTDINNCTDTLIKKDLIRVWGATAGFQLSDSAFCLKKSLQIRNTATSDGTHPITQIQWNMGNGSEFASTNSIFDYSYTAPGVYSIKQTVTDSKGCIDSSRSRYPVSVFNTKTRIVADSLSCPGAVMNFSNQTTGNSNLTTFTWNMGNGVSLTSRNVSYAYQNEGIYTVHLTATEPFGCIDSTRVRVKINKPVASFSVPDSASICKPWEVHFTNNSLFSNKHTWSFGDGTVYPSLNPIYHYNVPGTYDVKLISESPGGCKDSVTRRLRLGRDTGSLSYGPVTGCAPLSISLKTKTDFPLNYTWDLGDGTIINSNDSSYSHIYNAGYFVPKIIIQDKVGCTGFIIGNDTIKSLGSNPNFGADQTLICDSAWVQFIDSTFASDTITSYTWDFGDGSGSSLSNPAHFYNKPGSYTVQLKVNTKNNCTNTKIKNRFIQVIPSPKIQLTGDTSYCNPATIRLSVQYLNPDTSSITWLWKVDQDLYNTRVLPPLIKTQPQQFEAIVIATNSSGCKDSSFKTITVHGAPNVKAGNDTTICLGDDMIFQPTGATTYTWSPSTFLSCSNCTNPKASISQDIEYKLSGVSVYGCINYDSIRIWVKKPFKINVNNGDTLCLGDQYPLKATGAELYEWKPANGLSNNRIPNPISKPDSTITYTVIGSDSLNCFQDSGSIRIVVYQYPIVAIGNDTIIRTGSSLRFNPFLSPDVTSLKWTPPYALSCTNCRNPIASPVKSTNYTLEVKNIAGCTSLSTIKVTVICDQGNLFIPNAFTPNGDRLNERFYIKGQGINEIRSFRIFNRWGMLLFEKGGVKINDPFYGWDGTFKGTPQPEGIYTYSVELVCSNGLLVPIKGIVTLIR